MDNVNQGTTNLGPQQGPVQGPQSRFPVQFSKKWVIGISAGVLAILFIAFFALSQRGLVPSSSNLAQNGSEPTPNFEATENVVPTLSVEMKQAVNEAEQAATEYDNQQADLKEDYPWLRKLPLVDEKYYVYFDLEMNKFIGRLYPVAGDNIEKIKTDVLTQLRGKGVPVEKFQFDWSTPQ